MSKPLRFWNLSRMARSPMHYLHATTGPEMDPTYDMERGSATHAIIFGNHPVLGYLPKKKREGKDFDAFKAQHPPDAIILTATEYEKACRMAEAVWNNAEAMALMFPKVPGVAHEKTIHFEYMGRVARATPDALTPDALIELKTSNTSEPEKFMRHAAHLNYHAQLAFYMDAVQAAGGHARDAYVVAVESSAPHPVTVLRLTPRTLDQGSRACRLWFERLRACEESGVWPPYVQSVVDWDLDDDLELEFADDDEPAAEQVA